MTKSKTISGPKAALLALAIAAAGQPAGPLPVILGATQSAVEASVPQPASTQATPTAQAYNSNFAEELGSGKGRGRKRPGYNPIRRARRRLERIGIITSGRQWRHFRQLARSEPIVAELWKRALVGAV